MTWINSVASALPPKPVCLVDDLQMTCKTVPGVGGPFFWRISVAGVDSGSTSVSSSYPPPSITAVAVSSPGGGLATQGGTPFILSGSNFGVFSLELGRLRVVFGPTAALIQQYMVTGCVGERGTGAGNDVSVRCFAGPGVGGSMFFQVATDGVLSSTFASTVSYLPPNITDISAPALLSTDGSTPITFIGDVQD